LLGNAIANGDLPYHENWLQWDWFFPAKPTIDVGRESEANIEEINSGVNTGANVVAEAGLGDIQDVITQRSHEIEMMIEASQQVAERIGLPWQQVYQLMIPPPRGKGGGGGGPPGAGGGGFGNGNRDQAGASDDGVSLNGDGERQEYSLKKNDSDSCFVFETPDGQQIEIFYDPSEARDEQGRWTDEGEGESSGSTIREAWTGMTRTAAVKSHIRRIESGPMSYVADMNPDNVDAEIAKARNVWQNELGLRQQIQNGKAEITGRNLESMRHWEAREGKQMLPETWAENYGIPEAQRMLTGISDTEKSINALGKIRSRRSKQEFYNPDQLRDQGGRFTDEGKDSEGPGYKHPDEAGLTGIDKKIVDYVAHRPLARSSPDVKSIRDYVPGMHYVAYSKTPFFDELNKLQGTPDVENVKIEDFAAARKKLFKKQPKENLRIKDLIATQPVVNSDKVNRNVDEDNIKDVSVVRYDGKCFVVDGHHALAAAAECGYKKIAARVVDLSDKAVAVRAAHPDWTPKDVARASETPEKAKVKVLKHLTAVRPPSGRGDLARYMNDIKATPEYKLALDQSDHLAPPGTSEGDINAMTLRNNTDANGKLTKDRAILHEQIINQMLNDKAAVPQGKRPVVVMMIGKSGSGKTTVGRPEAEKIAKESTGNGNLSINDPDEARSYLPEYTGYNAPITQDEAKVISDGEFMNRAMAMHHNILIDQTGANSEKTQRISREMNKRGYDVHVVLAHKPLEQAMHGVWHRFQRAGRFVGADYLAKHVDDNPERTYNVLKADPDVKSLTYIDNTDNKGKVTERVKHD
jgi:adenylylsulfate kinase-like enzyme